MSLVEVPFDEAALTTSLEPPRSLPDVVDCYFADFGLFCAALEKKMGGAAGLGAGAELAWEAFKAHFGPKDAEAEAEAASWLHFSR